MNTEALHELTEHAETLAYQVILHSGLYHELSSQEWEALTEQFAAKLVEQAQGLVDAELTRIEGGKDNNNGDN